MRWDYSRANFRSAKESLRQAIALDPLNARARRELAWLAALGWMYRFDETPVPPHEILEQATKAVQLDPSVARARMVLAGAYLFNKQPDRFEHEAQQAIALAPYDAESLAQLGYNRDLGGLAARGCHGGKGERAQRRCRVRMVPRDALQQLLLDRRLRSRAGADQAGPRPAIAVPLYRLPPDPGRAWAQGGGTRELAEDTRRNPSWTAESFVKWYKTWNMRDVDIAKFMDGVSKSGVLEVEAKPGQ